MRDGGRSGRRRAGASTNRSKDTRPDCIRLLRVGRGQSVNVLIYLVPLALLLGLTGLIAFLWSLRSGQYDDLDGAALRILPDDDLKS
jgi:cbb3-type cytochrome oxidase maturation protein